MIIRRAAVAAFQRQTSRSTNTARYAARRSPPLFATASPQQFWMSTVAVPDAPTSNHVHSKLAGAKGRIIYTETDEAPALATYSLYPVVSKVRPFQATLFSVRPISFFL
jgi:hypothetical protein